MRLPDGILEVSICLVVIALSVVGTASAFVTGLRRDRRPVAHSCVCSDWQPFFDYIIRSGKAGRSACPSVAATEAACGWRLPISRSLVSEESWR